MRLAGTYHPIEYLLLRLEEFFPTLEYSGALYLKDNELHYILNGEKEEIEVIDQVNLQKIRSKRNFTVEWTKSPNLLDTPIYSKQHSLYDEEKNTTLLVHLPSSKRDLCDVVIMTFHKNQVMKGVDKVFMGLTTTEKSLIATFCLNVLKSEYERICSEQSLVLGFRSIQREQLEKIEQLKLSLKESKQMYLNSLCVLIQDYFAQLNEMYDCTFVASQDLIEKVAQLHLSLDEIYSNLKSAAELGYHLLYGEKRIEIPASYLKVKAAVHENKQHGTHDGDKVFLLLDRYEEAAEQLRSISKTINGKNIAQQLQPPITPPAITDAVKKNEKRIRFLLDQYTDRWILIRQFLKPIERINQNGIYPTKKAI